MPAGRPPHPDQLTPAEWRVVEAVRHGMTNAMIAERQGVSLDAVKYHVSAALRKLGFSNRRELRLWNGVRRDSRLEPGEQPMCTGASHKTIGQIARGVRDLDQAIAWYRDVLGLPLLFSFPGMAFFDCGGVRLYLSAVEAPANSVIYFRVRDLHAEVGRLIEAGVTLVSAPHRIHVHEDGREEWMAFVNDPDGAPLGLMTTTEPAA
ncbi:MAG TPA: VOC family protein [Caulobacter sp.]|nr:VOC family protein [Caulobacter sp.]